jgi:hypothetical protein
MTNPLNNFKYPDFLKGAMVTITSLYSGDYRKRCCLSHSLAHQKIRQKEQIEKKDKAEAPINLKGPNDHIVISRLWITKTNFDKFQSIIPDSLDRFNKFYDLKLTLADLQLDLEPIYAEVQNGVRYKMVNGKMFRRVRIRKYKKYKTNL